MATHQINGVTIHTSFDYPPIPVRNMDWSAVTDDYDCDCDQDGFFSTSPIGHGATEQDAIEDLLEQIADDGQHWKRCPTCQGRGLVSHPDSPDQEDCEMCDGIGEIESR